MLSPKPLTSIQGRFVILTTSILALVCTVILGLGAWYEHHSYQAEIHKVLTEQALNVMASHTQERKQQDYLSLQRILPHGELIESAALYNKDCKILTTTFNPSFPKELCPDQSSSLLRIHYHDVLSPIGTIVLKLNERALQPRHLFHWGAGVLLVFGFIGLLISICWKYFIYRPLNREIEYISNGVAPSANELGPLGDKINSMLQKVKSHESQKERLALTEQKFQAALKVAHDILAPLQVIKAEQTLNAQSLRSKQAILQIEDIAFDLLPEKAPISISPCSLNDLLSQAVTNAHIEFNQNPLPIIECVPELTANVSPLHLVRALTNLLKNSLEVQPSGTPLKIKIEQSEHRRVKLTIHDNGPGMPVNYNETTKAQGSGLGIKSAKDAISKMGGTLEFISSSAGTTTLICLIAAKKTIYLTPNETVYCFGFEANNTLSDISFINDTERTTILSPLIRPAHLTSSVRWIQITSPEEVELITLNSALLIEDDKYICAQWAREASKAGVKLEALSLLPKSITNCDVVFLDRYLGEVDSKDWERTKKAEGYQIAMMSAESGIHTKTPPWLLS